VLVGALDRISAVPTGVVHWYAGSTPPAGGWLECNGQAITQAEFPALFAIVGANVPDLRGEFVRGWDHNRGIDNNRALLSAQDEAFLSHDHNGDNNEGLYTNIMYETPGAGNNPSTSMGNRPYRLRTINAGGVEVGGDETRPRNIAMMGIIKT